MPSESVYSDHPDPIVNMIAPARCFPLDQVILEGANFFQSFGMVEHQQIFLRFADIGVIYLAQSLGDLFQRWRTEPGFGEHNAQRIYIAAARHAPHQASLDESSATSHKWVIYEATLARKPLDEKARQLRLKTGSIRNLMQTIRGSLFRSPKLIYKRGKAQLLAAEGHSWGFDDLGGLAELPEGGELFRE